MFSEKSWLKFKNRPIAKKLNFILKHYANNFDVIYLILVWSIQKYQKVSSICIGWMEIYGAGHSNLIRFLRIILNK